MRVKRKLIVVNDRDGDEVATVFVSGLVPILFVYLLLIAVTLWSISWSLDSILNIMGQVHDLLTFPGTFSPLTGCYTGRS